MLIYSSLLWRFPRQCEKNLEAKSYRIITTNYVIQNKLNNNRLKAFFFFLIRKKKPRSRTRRRAPSPVTQSMLSNICTCADTVASPCSTFFSVSDYSVMKKLFFFSFNFFYYFGQSIHCTMELNWYVMYYYACNISF